MRKTFAEINLKNLQHNFLQIKYKIGYVKTLAVVKADAYGHGMIECSKALLELGKSSPDYFGVALLEEGIELRKSKITNKPILLFSPFSEEEIDYYLKYDLIPTIASADNVAQIKKINRKLKIHINVDTGMGRLGLSYDESIKLILELASKKNLIIDGIYTHFACSDDKNKTFTKEQIKKFEKLLIELKKLKVNFGLAHAANSAAIIQHRNSYFDMVRPGISLYGYPPTLILKNKINLKPVMNIVTYVSTIRNIKKGESVSYGRIFIAKRDSKIATLPIGYADGLNRNLSNKIFAIINGKTFPQVGRITMDRIMIDVTDSNVKVNDKVVLLGYAESKLINGWDWCKILNTIPYEITCNVSKRVPRFYIEE